MAVPAGNTDTRSASLNQAYTLKLDVLSLESRAVRDMLPLDRSEARELFGQMPKPSLVPLTCDDSLAYQPLEFYEGLSAMVNGGFTPEEKAKDEHFKLLLDALGQVMSPSQLPPLAQAIESSSITPAQRQNLWARFNGLLADMQPDDRSFSASLPALFAISAPGIEPALEKYQQKNHGCETDSGSSSPHPSSRAPSERFQNPSAPDTSSPDTSSSDPSSPASSSGSQQRESQPTTPKLELFWQSANAKQLLEGGKKAALFVEFRTVLRHRSCHRRMAAAAFRLPESHRRLDIRSRGIRRRLLSREVPGLYQSARSGGARFPERQDTGRLCRFHQQGEPLSAKPSRMVRGTAHAAGAFPYQCGAAP